MQKREYKIATKNALCGFNSYSTNHTFIVHSIYILLSVAIFRKELIHNES